MNFKLSEEQQMLVETTRKLAQKYDRAYWLKHCEDSSFTHEMWNAFAELGFLGITVPEEYGGLGLGLFDLVLVQEELANHGVPLLMLIVGPGLSFMAIVRHGSEEQKQELLPGLISGKQKICFAITEPAAGTNTFGIQTSARRDGSDYILQGQKIFISGVDESDMMLVVARTGEPNPNDRKSGLSLFIVDTKSPGITYSQLNTQIVAPEKQFTVYFDEVRVPARNLIGEAGEGIRYLFDGLNPERIMVAASSIGLGRYALSRAVAYANERQVFGQPIGAYQALQHPMAAAKAHVEQASLMNRKAAWVYDQGKNAGEFANMAKLAAANSALEAADIAIQVHGGNGLTKEYDMMAVWSLCRLFKTAPVSNEMVLNYIGEHVLKLPKSY